MKKHLLFFAFSCFAMLSLAQSPGQMLRGKVSDADSGEPLAGVTVALLNSTLASGANTTESGSYTVGKLPVGRYQVQFSHLGYETQTIAEVLVESGRETVLNVQLREQPNQLQEVVVKAPSSNPTVAPINRLTFSVEEQFRFPATNFDPARLAMAYPGVAGNNDGTNVISVRGNSPNALQWRLEGVEIVNPNHTANAGTFGDRPTAAGGGVNILSAQLLGTSSMLTGAFPAQYGNSVGGIMDMYFRKGNDQRHELIAQAGFIGIEAAAEGPLSVRSPQSTVGSQPSFLVNYRYSFTGLLTTMGVDFGDEETAFQDVAFHVALPTAKAGQFSLFGVGGKSSTIYRSPVDSATIDKELYNIDFYSKMGALGMTHVLPLGRSNVLRTVVVASGLEHDRTADLVETGERWEDDHLAQSKLAMSSILTKKINARHRVKVGIEASSDNDDVYSFYKNNFVNFSGGIDTASWLVQPFVDWHWTSGKTEIEVGLHASIYSADAKLLEPRASVTQSFGKFGGITLAYGKHSNRFPTYILSSGYLSKNADAPVAHHLTLGYQVDISKSLIIKAEAYALYFKNVPVFTNGETRISSMNFTDFSQTYLGNRQSSQNVSLNQDGTGLNYGLDLSFQKYFTEKFYGLLAASLYKSQFSSDGPNWQTRNDVFPTRFDGRHTLNLTAGREFSKQKSGKTIINGISGRVAWLGGFRDTPINTEASAKASYTIYYLKDSFSEKLDDYFRIDLRLYKKWNKVGKNSMLSLDIQNLTSRKNIQYHYYDSVQGKVLEKRQLGLIPILTWRGEF